MKFRIAILIALATSAVNQTAFAQTGECRSLPDPGQRLACYDMAAPPAQAATSPGKRGTPAKSLNSKADIGSPEAISAEDALMNARMKNICRGC